ncbi:unnamed protein product [Phaedon cochleariae]|uniref:DUF3668 domain-containing protein n=1 Tax=Phaedon cochleariae TaxID=80249 RepID=A0A9P0DJR6_PHACE|nr:unnamed protein product [Phaedon cochleariae]
MHQLSGKYVNVVLSVECGRGMDFLKNSVHITGSFNNRILESDRIPAEDCPPFNTELVWEIEKKELRKIRSANIPLRVECITIDLHNRRERVGFTLLSLRSAHIISQKNMNQEVKSQWHKLIGCQSDKKRRHPELYISLTLQDHSLNELGATKSNEGIPYISEEVNTIEETTSSEFPIKYFEDGHIQIGEAGTGQSSFTFNLFVKKVVNLDALLPEVLVFKKTDQNYYLAFKIFGISIKTKPFSRELHNDITLNEKIVINLLSSEEMLRCYFDTQSTSIIFCRGDDILGVTSVEVEDIFSVTESRSFFKFPSANGIVPFESSDKSPCIELEHWIEDNVECEETEDDIQERSKTRTIFSSITQRPTKHVQSDQIIEDTPREGADDMYEEELVLCEKPETAVTKSIETFIKSDTLSPRLPEALNPYQRFTFEITLTHIVWKIPQENTKISFKFLHPRAASCTTILTEISNTAGKKITLNNLNVKVSYLSTPDKIEKQLKYWKPRLILTDDKEISLCNDHNLDVDCLEERSKGYEITLTRYQNTDPIAKVGVSVALKMIDVSESDDYEHLHLLPIIVDEIIMIKEIRDLEKWKQNEKDRFENELDYVKTTELERLEKDFRDRKNKLEEQVAMTVNKCKKLQDELMNKMNSMKVDKAIRRNRNHTQIYEDVFKENWDTFSEDNTREVIELLSRAQRDNQLLKEMCEEQRQKLTQFEKTSLTKTQTTNILQELALLEHKFEEAQTAKSYFKEQWKRACEEIHVLKTEDIKNMQIQIKESKEKLSQLSLDAYCEHQNQNYDDENEGDNYFHY